MKEFIDYFFGVGSEVEFELFTFAHFVPIIVASIIIYFIYKYKDELRNNIKLDNRLRYTIAFIMILSDMSYYWRLVGMPVLQPNPVDHLPISVCGWAAILGSYLMVGKNQTLFDIIYFWIFTCSIFAMITPAVITYCGPTRFRYYQFWIEHLIIFIGIFYMIFVHRMRPNIKSLFKSYAALLFMAFIAYNVNQLIGPGANYLFMAKPESTPSILDILPSNFALRISIMLSAITLLYGVVYLPWYLKDKKSKGTS